MIRLLLSNKNYTYLKLLTYLLACFLTCLFDYLNAYLLTSLILYVFIHLRRLINRLINLVLIFLSCTFYLLVCSYSLTSYLQVATCYLLLTT